MSLHSMRHVFPPMKPALPIQPKSCPKPSQSDLKKQEKLVISLKFLLHESIHQSCFWRKSELNAGNFVRVKHNFCLGLDSVFFFVGELKTAGILEIRVKLVNVLHVASVQLIHLFKECSVQFLSHLPRKRLLSLLQMGQLNVWLQRISSRVEDQDFFDGTEV